ncbi:SIMPL domain-containing protein [Anabaena sp. FACHB-1237]|uniref:SIMPL domain-containing protein n=1 Tax=Anabaena sp. FACHB-1237 TaxID=2692769 RepID=UPI0016810632|nr:SIMPL domain-containing protein [Anabaena sp. FACHB-1237]MBD2137484.1 SIMPL domain-containing protein [Anabaena sp. FACHB-1237]
MLKTALFPNKTRNWWQSLPLSFLLCVVFILPATAQERERLLRTLTVTGRGIENVPTTLSQVSLGVEVQGKTPQEVQKEAARRSSSVVDLLKNRNVYKLQTTGVTLNPIYSYTNNVQKITGYTASNTVSFRVKTDETGNLLDESVKAGATQINGISFVASEDAIASAQKIALKKATQDAQDQAKAVLSSLGLEQKDIVNISINGATPAPQPIVYRTEGLKANMADASTAIVPGEQEVQASVMLQITY